MRRIYADIPAEVKAPQRSERQVTRCHDAASAHSGRSSRTVCRFYACHLLDWTVCGSVVYQHPTSFRGPFGEIAVLALINRESKSSVRGGCDMVIKQAPPSSMELAALWKSCGPACCARLRPLHHMSRQLDCKGTSYRSYLLRAAVRMPTSRSTQLGLTHGSGFPTLTLK